MDLFSKKNLLYFHISTAKKATNDFKTTITLPQRKLYLGRGRGRGGSYALGYIFLKAKPTNIHVLSGSK